MASTERPKDPAREPLEERRQRGLGARAALRLALAAAAFAAATMILFPWCATAAVASRQIKEILSFAGTEPASLCDRQAEEEMAAARAYNAVLCEKQRTEPFHYKGESAGDSSYEACLAGGQAMYLLEIPKIFLIVPVIHGTKSAGLETSAGHFYGTSLPCGGVPAHAGIAAHSGLPDNRLFTDLVDLSEGDRFYIHIMNETHVYRIDEICVVEPEEADGRMQIVKGRDLITLYTCTPYGLNTHRLLVRGERDPEAENALAQSAGERDQSRLDSLSARLRRKAFECLLKISLFSGAVTAASFMTALYLAKKRSMGNI